MGGIKQKHDLIFTEKLVALEEYLLLANRT